MSQPLKSYVFRGTGVFLQCEVVVVAYSIESAIKLISKTLEDNNLLKYNSPISENDISEFSIDYEKVVFFWNGDY